MLSNLLRKGCKCIVTFDKLGCIAFVWASTLCAYILREHFLSLHINNSAKECPWCNLTPTGAVVFPLYMLTVNAGMLGVLPVCVSFEYGVEKEIWLFKTKNVKQTKNGTRQFLFNLQKRNWLMQTVRNGRRKMRKPLQCSLCAKLERKVKI